jgi:hypothetical protein
LSAVFLAIEVRPVDRPAQRAVERLLRNWASFMHGTADVTPQGCPRRASGGLQSYTSLDLDNVAAYENLDTVLAEKTDAVIASLTPVEQSAIHHKYLHAVYRFQRETLEAVLGRAKHKIEIGLRARDVWLGD